MAKTLKKITCPQCGSNNVHKHEHDYYMCNSCNTRFFLDTEDVTITHKHVQQTAQPSFTTSGPKKKNSVGKIILIGLLITVSSISFIFNIINHNKPKENTFGTYEASKNERLYYSTQRKIETVKIDDNKSVLVNVAFFNKNSLPDDQQDHIYVFVHDLPSGKGLKKIDLEVDLSIKGKGTDSFSEIITVFRDSKDQLYFIINKYYLFRFDEKTLDMVDVSKSYFEGVPEFESGIVGIDFKEKRLGSFIQVTDNNGIKYAYSRDLAKIYKYDSEKAFWKILELELPNPTLETRYDFVRFDDEYSDKPIQLIKYTIKAQKGYFVDNVYFKWNNASYYDKDRGVQVNEDRIEANTYKEVTKRITKYDNFTPDRTYVPKGKVLGQDQEGVIIAIKMTQLDSEPFTIQKLKHTDGSVLWTQKTDWSHIWEVLKQVSNNYLVVSTDHRNGTVIDTKTGEIKDTIKFEYPKGLN